MDLRRHKLGDLYGPVAVSDDGVGIFGDIYGPLILQIKYASFVLSDSAKDTTLGGSGSAEPPLRLRGLQIQPWLNVKEDKDKFRTAHEKPATSQATKYKLRLMRQYLSEAQRSRIPWTTNKNFVSISKRQYKPSPTSIVQLLPQFEFADRAMKAVDACMACLKMETFRASVFRRSQVWEVIDTYIKAKMWLGIGSFQKAVAALNVASQKAGLIFYEPTLDHLILSLVIILDKQNPQEHERGVHRARLLSELASICYKEFGKFHPLTYLLRIGQLARKQAAVYWQPLVCHYAFDVVGADISTNNLATFTQGVTAKFNAGGLRLLHEWSDWDGIARYAEKVKKIHTQPRQANLDLALYLDFILAETAIFHGRHAEGIQALQTISSNTQVTGIRIDAMMRLSQIYSQTGDEDKSSKYVHSAFLAGLDYFGPRHAYLTHMFRNLQDYLAFYKQREGREAWLSQYPSLAQLIAFTAAADDGNVTGRMHGVQERSAKTQNDDLGN
ncbi:hypothetical protein LTR51_008537 [Lithohypha guttulata]|nr:hypothetical protein LTR51_008537 [Lithohypha guttulata]